MTTTARPTAGEQTSADQAGADHGGRSAARDGGLTYARARLYVGVFGVGTWVVLAAAALAFGVPDAVGAQYPASGLTPAALGVIAGFAALHALIQAPFDFFGGYRLPRRFARSELTFGRWAMRWLRGVLAWNSTLALSFVGIAAASHWIGPFGPLAAVVGLSLLLLGFRLPLARLVGIWRINSTEPAEGVPTAIAHSDDPGFTGAITGLVRARLNIVPERWRATLTDEQYETAVRRRATALNSGSWQRGRLVGLGFTWIGAALASWFAADLAGTAAGVIEFSLLFSLWSFAGLLVLPSVSRHATASIDATMVSNGADPRSLGELALELDRLQDEEPARPKWIERIFHPIPDAGGRGAGARVARFAAWDAARVAIFLGLSAGGLLGRSVHCNAGRPDLWVMLPTD
ncbi:MAG: hypothetical protein AAFR96_12680 [Planctomycetota bacterium]